MIVRINDPKITPSAAVFDAVRRTAEAAGLQIVDGDRRSLRQYFQAVEVWREDVLLTPVVILDQFEELMQFHMGPVRGEQGEEPLVLTAANEPEVIKRVALSIKRDAQRRLKKGA